IALGADLVGLAHPFLLAANESEESVALLVNCLLEELRTVLLCTGYANFATLRRSNALQRLNE
ncbi:MAG: alpha-hydroxy-acid oxidizing protein, partial [Cyanobacteria bacterium P01_H01_bin.153]